MKELTFCYCLNVSLFVLIINYLQARFTPFENMTKNSAKSKGNFSTFRHVILVAQPRTGSTIISQAIANNGAIFYSLEPLNIAMRSSVVRINGSAAEWRYFLKQILLCNFTGMDQYHLLRMKRLWHLSTTLVKDLCYWDETTPNTYCDFPEYKVEETVCRRSKLHFVKTIYLRLETAMSLLADPDLNLALIYLVRDPRGILHSRQNTKESHFFFASSMMREDHLCQQMGEDIIHLRNLERTFPHRILLVRYEDFALNPINETARIYRFLGLKFKASRAAFTATRTMNIKEPAPMDSFSTDRNSRKRVFRWMEGLSVDEISAIQTTCQDVLRVFNYQPFSP